MSDIRIKVEFAEAEPSVTQSEPIRIKQEKIDLEIEEKINSACFGTLYDADNTDRKPTIGPKGCMAANLVTIEFANRLSNVNTATADEDSNSYVGLAADEKKSIEPVKSSNEILAELFRVFNAAPPEELLNDDNLLKKAKHRKHKKGKKKKKKKSKSDVRSDGEHTDVSVSSASSVNSKEDDARTKHKKHKKHKHKDERVRVKEKSKERVKSKDKSKDRGKSKESDRKKSPLCFNDQLADLEVEKESFAKHRKRHSDDDNTDPLAKKSRTSYAEHHKHREMSRENDKGHNSFYNGFRDEHHDRNTNWSNDRNRTSTNDNQKEVRIKKEPIDQIQDESDNKNSASVKDEGHISEISLSDEETYLKERNHAPTRRRRFCNGESRHESSYMSHNSFYAGAERSHSRDRNYRYRHRARSRSRSRSRDLGIDKKRLLEIARKNVISMFKRGNLPGCEEMTEEVKDKVLLKMRYGGRTVQDLTEFCKKLSNGENLNDISDLSSEEDSDVDKGGNVKAFNHPFMIKEREPIVMHIRGSAPIVPKKNDDQTKAITMQFPVSSGQQHRMTEAWVPVASKEPHALLPASSAASQSANTSKDAPGKNFTKNIFQKSMPVQAEQEPAFKAANAHYSTPAPTFPEILQNAVAEPTTPAAATGIVLPPTPLPPISTPPNLSVPPPFVPDVPVPSAVPSNTVFPVMSTSSVDVSSIISKRLNAMRRLQENPTDSEALKMMYNSQKEMSSWACSKHIPGQFTGSTGVNVLSVRELNSGPQMWARRDQLTSAQPMTGGMGMQLLKKMGWKPGEGLGREKTGSLQPLLLDVKLDKRGLVSEEDNGYQRQQHSVKKRRNASVAQAQQNLQEKHPVSLLNELTSKRKWTPPLYTMVNEGGPSHSKMFWFSVSINGQTFTPTLGSNTKKDAKVIAARHCLQQMGIIP